MKRYLPLMVIAVLFTTAMTGQTLFDETIDAPAGYAPTEIVMPPSPLTTQVLFVGGVDMVQTTDTYGNPAGETPAKEWNDFIGFTADDATDDLGWISINHERILADDMIGDGGGMTVFKVRRNADGELEVVDQTLSDGRAGQFFNVDFANTTGETGMNCGGIASIVDGRIWTAEEWFRTSNASIHGEGEGVRDTADYTISSDIPGWNGVTVEKYQNFNWMTEIDPREAVAIRKQYNWGRQPFEGGAVEPGNRIVYLGPDATPGFFGMFVANTPGDFTKGTLFAYKHDKPGYNWVPIWEDGSMLDIKNTSVAKGATMYNRIEWVAIDPYDNNVYWTETGRDNPGTRWADEDAAGAVHDPYHLQRAIEQGVGTPNSPDYTDFYGRIWKYDPVADICTVHLEAGPYFDESPAEADYPEKHLSNPDGLSVMQIDGRSYLVIQEDLNGTSHGRVPMEQLDGNRFCELYLLDLTIQNPTIDDLIRLTAVPAGAEVTGAIATPDGKSLLVNVQHPSTDNPFPYNHSLTFAINGFDQVSHSQMNSQNPFQLDATAGTTADETEAFSVYPNPTTRVVYLNKSTDVAIYDAQGQRILVERNKQSVDVSGLTPGVYYIQNEDGETLKLSIQ